MKEYSINNSGINVESLCAYTTICLRCPRLQLPDPAILLALHPLSIICKRKQRRDASKLCPAQIKSILFVFF